MLLKELWGFLDGNKITTSDNMGLKIPLRSIANLFGKGSRPKPHKLLKSQGRYMQ